MPLSITPSDRLILSWDMFTIVPDSDIPSANGRAMDAETKCRFDVLWDGSQVDVTVTVVSLKVRIGAQQTSELLKHEQGHADLTWLAGLAAGRETLRDMRNAAGIGKKHGARSDKTQISYDDNTEHGTNDAHQTRWNGLLDAAILHKQAQVGHHSL